jgi:hypothetical protein
MSIDNELSQQIIKADSEFDAVVNYFGTKPPGISDLEELLDWAWDQDILIDVIEI